MEKVKKNFISIIAGVLILFSVFGVLLTINRLVYRPTDNFVFFIVYSVITVVVTVFGIKFKSYAGRLSKVSACFLPLLAVILSFNSAVDFDYPGNGGLYVYAVFFMIFIASLVLFFTNVKRVWAIIVQGVFIMIVNLIFLMGFVLALVFDNFGTTEIVYSGCSHDNEYKIMVIEHDAGALGFDRVEKRYDNKPNINLLLGGIYDDVVVVSLED